MKLVLIWIPILLLGIYGFAEHPPAQQPAADNRHTPVKLVPLDVSEETNLKSAVEDWVKALSAEKGFEKWQSAKWESLPVGPGTHSWLVIVRNKNLEVGYLVVGAMEDGKHYKLLEYGLGQQPLFSLNTLYHSLMQQALIDSSVTFKQFSENNTLQKERFYSGSLESYWKITHHDEAYYLDAKTGEQLLNGVQPIEKASSTSNSIDLLSTDHKPVLKESLISPEYDPFEKASWIKGKPLQIDSFTALKSAVKAHPQLVFMGKLYNQSVIHPFAITGYQVWQDGQIYIALADDGPRYVPLSELLQAGAFYP